ncbi:hypothetical protein, partial [Dissulfurirhabdus thermomarina]
GGPDRDGAASPAGRCIRCIHYYVTWEPRHPHGCRGFGFKSREAPEWVVRESSGAPCRLFEPRGGREGR